jgi:hypothetical protein
VEVTAACFKVQCCKYLPGSTGKPRGTLVPRSPKYNQEYYAVPCCDVQMVGSEDVSEVKGTIIQE